MPTSVRATFKRRFFVRIFFLIPLIITILLLGLLFIIIDGLLEPLYYKIPGHHVPGLSFISLIVLIFIVRAILTNIVITTFIKYIENIFLKIPLFKCFYVSIKQIIDAFSPEIKSSSFKQFVIFEYTPTGVFCFRFSCK
jgi:uncharacterized membrane protein